MARLHFVVLYHFKLGNMNLPTIRPMLTYKKATFVANMLTRKPTVTKTAPMMEVARFPSLAHATEAIGPERQVQQCSFSGLPWPDV